MLEFKKRERFVQVRLLWGTSQFTGLARASPSGGPEHTQYNQSRTNEKA